MQWRRKHFYNTHFKSQNEKNLKSNQSPKQFGMQVYSIGIKFNIYTNWVFFTFNQLFSYQVFMQGNLVRKDSCFIVFKWSDNIGPCIHFFPLMNWLNVFSKIRDFLVIEWQFCQVKGLQFSSVQSRPTLRPHELQHARPPCPTPTPRAHPKGLPCSSNSKESSCSTGDLGLIPGSGRSSGEGNGNPQYSCQENPMDRVASWATIHGITESDMTEWLTLRFVR